MGIYSSYIVEEKFSEKAPRDINLSFLTQANFDEFIDSKFTIFETETGIYFRLIFQVVDGKDKINVYLDKKNSAHERKIIDAVNKGYVRQTYRFFNYFEKVSMCFYGVYISKENDSTYTGADRIVFYDVYLNDNFIKNDDLQELFETFKIPTLKQYKKSINLSTHLVKEMDEFINNNGLKKSLYLKSDDELYFGNRSQKLGSFIYYGEGLNKQKKTPKEEDERLKIAAKKVVDDVTINKYVNIGWESTLKAMNIPICKENKEKILSVLVGKFTNIYQHRITQAAEEFNVFEDDIEKYIRKYLPRIIIAKLNIGS